jgi:hypothetical protein
MRKFYVMCGTSAQHNHKMNLKIPIFELFVMFSLPE